MRKITCFFAVAALMLVGTVAAAQNRSINFAPEDITIDQMFLQAEASGRTIFMDCYTSWCGPCKMMARDVFTDDDVADFFNENFYCVKFDMEKGEGKKLNDEYGVSAFPTMLFIDASSRTIVHTVVGARKPEELIAEARKALNPGITMEAARTAWEKDKGNEKAVKDYLKVLEKAHLGGIMNEVALNYLDGMNKSQIAQNWDIFNQGIFDAECEPAETVFANRKYFARKVGKREVDAKLEGLLYMLARPFIHSKAVGPDAEFDEDAYNRVKAFVEKSGSPSAASTLLQMRATMANQKEDYAGVLACLYEDLEGDVVSQSAKQYFRASNVARLIPIQDENLREKAYQYFDDAFKKAADDLERANILRMKGIVLDQHGQKELAAKAMEESIVYARRNAESARAH